MRFGDIKGALGLNEVPTDALSLKIDQWNQGPSIAAGSWVCLQLKFDGTGAQHAFTATVDGQLVHEVTSADQWHTPVPATWLDGKYKEFMIGWHSFNGISNELWFDDLVVSTAHVPCN